MKTPDVTDSTSYKNGPHQYFNVRANGFLFVVLDTSLCFVDKMTFKFLFIAH